MGKVVMYASVSLDGFVADENDQPGPLFDWLTSGDVPLDGSGVLKVSQKSYDYIRPYWDQIGVTITGRHVFDMTDGWDGKPPSGIDHVVVVTHRPAPEGGDPDAPFHFVDGIEASALSGAPLTGQAASAAYAPLSSTSSPGSVPPACAGCTRCSRGDGVSGGGPARRFRRTSRRCRVAGWFPRRGSASARRH